MEDFIFMYLIVKSSLNMSAGKIGAQCGHAVGMLYQRHHDLVMQNMAGWTDKTDMKIWDEWQNNFYSKITLACKDKDWEKVKLENPNHVLVIDSGKTEISPNSETCIGLWPMWKSNRPKLIKKLQLL